VNGNPTIITKNAETTVTLFDGQTTVIGGLNKDKSSGGEKGFPELRIFQVWAGFLKTEIKRKKWKSC